MKKSQLTKKLNELASVLSSEAATKAIKILKAEISSYREPKNIASSTSGLVLPPEVQGHTDRIALYTDGACRGNPGPGSWAYLIQNSEGEIVEEGSEHEEHTTNNKMELKAILFGLKTLESSGKEVWVYTDSKYAVDGMKSWVTGWKRRGWKKADKKVPENVEIWKELDLLNTKMDISFNWVKGHSGHPQNEYVDQLANKELDENGF